MIHESAELKRYPFYIQKFPQGMTAGAWFPLLIRNHFAVSPARMPFTLYLCLSSFFNSALSAVQNLIFSKDIANMELGAPLFIIGHWRTGTTWLHELLSQDKQFVAPNTLECFAPAQCLIAGWLVRMLTFLPRKRPMDDMAVGWDRPQEDELALLNLGLGSPYETIIFPNHRPVQHEFLSMRNVTPEQLRIWKAGWMHFLKQVVFRAQREEASLSYLPRLLLKSPTHTARINLMRQLFPKSQFIHLVRHPYEIFASTLLLWRTLFQTQGCQKPQFGQLPANQPSIEAYVLDTMDLLYCDFPQSMPEQQLCQVRYEHLVRNPLAEARRIYAQLNLGPFDEVRPRMEDYLLERKAYKANEHQISTAQRAAVLRRWRWYFEKYDYHP
jgi:omega-hydroxy-beta-dihydromenaquinone-9 sulfotransferase